MNLRGKFTTDEQGQFWFTTIKMSGYPVPTDGVVGSLLAAQGRHPFRPARLHVLIAKAGFKTLISQIYDPADPYIETDVQFGMTEAATGRYVRHDDAGTSSPAASGRYTLVYRFVMESGEMLLPKPPIK
jgi:catechol 1,2-dioxygenase